MKVKKSLLSCSFTEALPQIIAFKDAVDEWAKETGFFEKLRFQYVQDETKTAEENDIARRAEFAGRLNSALSSALVDYPALTTRVVCAFFFIPEKDIEKYSLADLLTPILETVNDKRFLDFFMRFAPAR